MHKSQNDKKLNIIYLINSTQKRLIRPKKETIIVNKMNFWQLFREFNHIDVINDGGKKTISL